MSDTSTDGVGATPVTIFGRTYHLRGDEGPAVLEELASIVDAKMTEIAEVAGNADTLKIAILASLNIADDFLKACEGGTLHESKDADKRLARMVAMLDEALVE